MGIFRFLGGAAVGAILAPVTGGASWALAAAASGTAAHLIGKDNDRIRAAEAREQGYASGFAHGFRKGQNEAGKKFAALLRQSDNMRIGSFAMGWYVAHLGASDTDQQLGVIVDSMGRPDSDLLPSHIRSANSSIIRNNPGFGSIKNDYLYTLNGEQLRSIDSLVAAIITTHSDGKPTYIENEFYNSNWAPYLNSRA